MRHEPLRLGVATPGGDSPGMNACLRAVVRAAVASNCQPIGIKHGVLGLARGAHDDFSELSPVAVASLLEERGTVLGSSREGGLREYLSKLVDGRSLDLSDSALLAEGPTGERVGTLVAQRLVSNGIQALVLIGGDRTSRVAMLTASALSVPFPIVVIPASIDNDVKGSEITIGFDSAVSAAVAAVDNIRATARAMSRLFVVEVMGNRHGHIAAEVALACGAEGVIVPDKPPACQARLQQAAERISRSRRTGRSSGIIIVAEGARFPGQRRRAAAETAARFLADQLPDMEIRLQIIGYVQRGAPPTAQTRVLAARCGADAVDRILKWRADPQTGNPELCAIRRSGDLVFEPLTGSVVQSMPGHVQSVLELIDRIASVD